VRERYLKFLARWPVANQQLRVPTRQGETFVVACGDACGDEAAPPLLLMVAALFRRLQVLRKALAGTPHKLSGCCGRTRGRVRHTAIYFAVVLARPANNAGNSRDVICS
jgi:hypothetical protein